MEERAIWRMQSEGADAGDAMQRMRSRAPYHVQCLRLLSSKEGARARRILCAARNWPMHVRDERERWDEYMQRERAVVEREGYMKQEWK
jgi:hypothetical protein